MSGIGDPNVTRMLVVFLRFYARMTQGQLAAASGVYQSEISLYELGDTVPTERKQRRLAEAVGLDWPLVVQLRRAIEAVVHAADARAVFRGPADENLHSALTDLALLAITPYILEAKSQAPEPTREQITQEAEEIWANLAPFAPKQRRKYIELGPRASRNWALAILACQASVSEAGDADEAMELAELAIEIAERAPGQEEWKSRLQGYCLAHLARAHQAANRPDEATRTFDRAWRLWQAGADLVPPALKEWPLPGLGDQPGAAPVS
jgi:transcriptional regulator with XRE-family HTH domain